MPAVILVITGLALLTMSGSGPQREVHFKDLPGPIQDEILAAMEQRLFLQN